MKICPFMSHMLGAEGKALEIDAPTRNASGDVVVLGYDDAGSVGVKTERKSGRGATAARGEATASHLYCLRETCRFYRTADGDCTFDALLEGVTQQAKAASKSDSGDGKDASRHLSKELEKFWKFQTQSAAELISSFGEAEKRQTGSIERMVSEVGKHVSTFIEAEDDRDERLNIIRDGVVDIKDTIDARNDGFETLTTTVSDLVISFEDNLKEMKTQYASLADRIADLEKVAPRVESVQSSVEKTIENLNRLERNWAELMDAVRNSKKKGDDSATQARRREAMKFNNLGVTSFHNGDLELARDQFLEAVARDDSFAECYNNLGLVYTELGETDAAAEAFQKAIRLNSDLHAAYNNLGYVYYKQGNFDRAVEMYNEALGRSPNNSSAYTNLGNAYFKLGKKGDAKKAWEKAIELDPSNSGARRSLNSLDD